MHCEWGTAGTLRTHQLLHPSIGRLGLLERYLVDLHARDTSMHGLCRTSHPRAEKVNVVAASLLVLLLIGAGADLAETHAVLCTVSGRNQTP